jgi:hypothetical protein
MPGELWSFRAVHFILPLRGVIWAVAYSFPASAANNRVLTHLHRCAALAASHSPAHLPREIDKERSRRRRKKATLWRWGKSNKGRGKEGKGKRKKEREIRERKKGRERKKERKKEEK